MGTGEIVFRTNRLKLMFWIVGGALLGVACLSPWLLVDIRAGHIAGSRGMILLLLPPDVRVALFEVFGSVMIAFSVLQLRLLVDNRLVFIDDEGIRVRDAFRARSGRWRDFKGMRHRKTGRRQVLALLFAPKSDAGSAARYAHAVKLPSPIYGVPRESLLREIGLRTRPVAGQDHGATVDRLAPARAAK